jgi:transcriptional regulator with XRE-family HTH domain
MPTKRREFFETLRAQYLGERMRELRDDRGYTLKFASQYIRIEFSTLARYERAEWPFRREHVKPLLDFYGVYDDATREELLTLAQTASRMNQWHQDGVKPVLENRVWVDPRWVESRATDISLYATRQVPALLQVKEYAVAAVRQRLAENAPRAMVDKALAAVLERQRQLTDRKPTLRVVLSEAVLRQQLGSKLTLRTQLEYLAQFAATPHLELRIIPPGAAAEPGAEAPFTLYDFSAPYAPVVHLEHLGGWLLIEGDGARHYLTAYELLQKAALGREDSLAAVHAVLDELA